MASSGLRKILCLTISNTLGVLVLVLVYPVILQTHLLWWLKKHTQNGRCCNHQIMLVDAMPNLIMYSRHCAMAWQML